jgi:cytochrome c peroxidase
MKIKITPFLVALGCLFLISSTIDLNNLFNYADQPLPNYISKDNTPLNNEITDAGATLGRVLFYDKNLSVDNTIACASCHKQAFAFGDTAQVSIGVAGVTGRHSMRLINARFANESRFFWDERANSLEVQTTMPIQDHVEMGFSGANGDPDLDSLIRKLEAIPYYQELFEFVYGTPQINEGRMRRALAQFVRSIQSYDSKYDAGLSMVNNINAQFPNFTPQENLGKNIFTQPPNLGGAGCQGCHQAPEFDIAQNSRNNGVIGVVGFPDSIDITVTRAPSLRDIVNPNGLLNGPLMHNGAFTNLMTVINHYDSIPPNPANTNLDPRLAGPPGGPGTPPPAGQNLQLTQNEKDALAAFLRTLTGQDVYTNEKWSNPFDSLGNLTIIPVCGQVISTAVEATICDGGNFDGYTESGSYEDIFTSINGCDSIRMLTLTVLPNIEVFIEATICEGEDWEGFELAGTYTQVFAASNGCDSTHTLELNVLPATDPACTSNAVDDPVAEVQLHISPNPFKDYLNINCDCELELDGVLYNMYGEKIMEQTMDFRQGVASFRTNDLAPGIYILIGFDQSGKKYFAEKLIKG